MMVQAMENKSSVAISNADGKFWLIPSHTKNLTF